VDLNPASATNQYNLGTVQQVAADFGAAVVAYREAIRIDEKLAEAHCNLRHALTEEGRFAEALTAIEKGHRLGSARPDWQYPSDQWLKESRRLVELDARLPGILNGTALPVTAAEQLEYAAVCKAKGLYAASASLYAGAFTTQPALASSPESGRRYTAACAAALAGCGRGRDGASGKEERTRWRKQALDWLRADLTVWTDRLSESPDAASALRGALDRLRREQALAGIREPEDLAELPEVERAGYIRFWAEVQELLVRSLASRPGK
jgi:serine/threonine-protein kinase